MDNVTSELRKFYLKAYLGISDIRAAKYWLVFPASVPPLGWNTYFISKGTQKGRRRKFMSMMDVAQNETINIGPGNLKLSISTTSGQLTRIFNSKTGVDIPVQQSYLWYASSPGDATTLEYIF
ncbi:probable alpha-mannosidase At5g66150 [Salvia miltiorrhiza]|uniref:probable alpha-mannosidase At5g66150 n=1 Tax=Salvia miltiorrhiza TaxID=226208 RepID=UPI0025ACCB4D|nr:probable alpha-mannosidase At5g66150 [Salvia miltiorrhiza]